MNPRPHVIARCALVSLSLLTFVTTSSATQYYATPAGAGSQNGASWANAWPESQIQTALDGLAAGDTLNLGSGTYSLTALSIAGDGTATNLKTILGVDTGGGLPLFQGTFNVNNSANGRTFITIGSANYWLIKNLQFKNHPFVIALPLSGTSYTLRTNITFENLAFDTIEDGIRIFNSSNILVKNCTVIRHTKKAFRFGDYSAYITFQGCSTDCNGGDDTFPARSIPTGFCGDDIGGAAILHDIQLIDCTARNCRFKQTNGTFWNGDGFSTERGTSNVTFLRCASYDNHDAGFDNKAINVSFQDCISVGNRSGYKHWSAGGTMVNCVAAFCKKWEGASGFSDGLEVNGGTGAMTADFCTFDGSGTIVNVSDPAATATVNDCILSTASPTATFTSGSGTATLTNCDSWRTDNSAGTDPDYVGYDASWRGSPIDAMDSQTYGATKGYNSGERTGSDTTAPSVPSGLAASSIAGTSFNLSWSASTDNVAVTGYEVFEDGVSYAVPSGTSVSVSGLAPGTTYAMTVRARDASGNWSVQSSALNVTTTAASGTVRIEAGGAASFTDSAGNVWAADTAFVGGSTIDRGAIAIANTSDPRIYQTERYGMTGYAIAVPNGTYTVNLHFAETYSGITGTGQRVFSVTAEGTSPTGWSNIDVFAETGGRNIALVKTASVMVADGTLNLGFSSSVESPMIDGIEVIQQGGDTTAPGVPTGLASSNITSASFTLSWSASTDNVGVTGYEVFKNGVSCATPAGTSVSVTGLSASTTYAMTVRARDAAGNWSAQSSALNVTTAAPADTQAPSVPASLAAGAVTSTSFTLTWGASSDNVGVTGYEVFKDGVSCATPSGTSANITGLDASTTYAMTVRARDAAGNWSAESAALNVTTAAGTSPIRIEAGSNAAYTDAGSNVWAADSGYTGGSIVDRGAIAIANTTDDKIYQTERWGLTGYAFTVPNGTYTVKLHFAETYTGITAAGQRVFSVTAEGASPTGWTDIDVYAETGGRNIALVKTASVVVSDGTLNLNFSSSVENTMVDGIEILPATPPDTTAPSVPSGLVASNVMNGSFTLSWTASTDNVGVTGYEVFKDGISYATPAEPTVNVSDLAGNTTYSLTVRARDAAGNWSAQSSALNVTTLTSESIGVNLTDANNSLAATDVAGAVPQAHWNNSTVNNQSLSNVVDSTGAATTAHVSFGTTPWSYNNSTTGTSGDAKMMRSYRAGSNTTSIVSTSSQIPYALYDVYVYWGGRRTGDSVPATMAVDFQLWDGTAWVSNQVKYIKDGNHAWDGTYDESTATSAAAAVDGNEYVVFRNVTATTFKLVATTAVRVGFSGFQIVKR